MSLLLSKGKTIIFYDFISVPIKKKPDDLPVHIISYYIFFLHRRKLDSQTITFTREENLNLKLFLRQKKIAFYPLQLQNLK